MPKLADNLVKCVFYLYSHNPETGKLSELKGTGFLVARQSSILPYTWHVYAVSNRHVVGNHGGSSLRINTKNGSIRFIEYEPTDWTWSDTSDLAIIDVTDQLDLNLTTGIWSDEISWVDEINFVPEQHRSGYGIGVGDNTIMLGLFANHSNAPINMPVGRFGNVAAIPNESNPVRLTPVDLFAGPAYLNDIRSRTGFSGSPVWVWRTPSDDMDAHKNAQGIWPSIFPPQSSSFLALIGIHRGQFPDLVQIRLSDTGRYHDAEIPSSMTVVVPAWEITNLMNKTALIQIAAQRDQRPERITYSETISSIMRAQEGRITGSIA
ncbi:MAG: hypothetical protein WCC64_09970 [Aliidongia sp.]